MSDQSSAITEARYFYLERQQVVLDDFSCSDYAKGFQIRDFSGKHKSEFPKPIFFDAGKASTIRPPKSARAQIPQGVAGRPPLHS
jgi:hypothetical protein